MCLQQVVVELLGPVVRIELGRGVLVNVPAAAGVGRRVRHGAVAGPGQVLTEAARPVPEVVHDQDREQAALLQLVAQAQQAGHAGRVVLPGVGLQRRHDPQRLGVGPLRRAHDAQHVDPHPLQKVEIAPHLIPAGAVAVARVGQRRPIVEAVDEERFVVFVKARATHLQTTRQPLPPRRGRCGGRGACSSCGTAGRHQQRACRHRHAAQDLTPARRRTIDDAAVGDRRHAVRIIRSIRLLRGRNSLRGGAHRAAA